MTENDNGKPTKAPRLLAPRRQIAQKWWEGFIVLAVLTTFGGAVGAGYLFAIDTSGRYYESSEFNAGAALAVAFGTVLAWLPIVALFDYLRRADA